MKNRILTLIAACMAALCASAQTTDSLPDTLTNRPSDYYYYNWYDTCVMFKAGIDTYSLYNLTRQKANPSNVMHGVIANEHITKSHMAVKGLAAMVVSSSTTWPRHYTQQCHVCPNTSFWLRASASRPTPSRSMCPSS